jgi:hypothetical protein
MPGWHLPRVPRSRPCGAPPLRGPAPGGRCAASAPRPNAAPRLLRDSPLDRRAARGMGAGSNVLDFSGRELEPSGRLISVLEADTDILVFQQEDPRAGPVAVCFRAGFVYRGKVMRVSAHAACHVLWTWGGPELARPRNPRHRATGRSGVSLNRLSKRWSNGSAGGRSAARISGVVPLYRSGALVFRGHDPGCRSRSAHLGRASLGGWGSDSLRLAFPL